MDPHSFIARAEAQRWIGIAEKLLISNDFVGSKTFAIRARESDPRLETADQILAIADTLLAAEKRVIGNNGVQKPDFYAILQLVQFVQDTDHIAAQYRRLAVALNPHQNRFPYSEQAFQVVNDAWAVLSNPMRKSLYDAELDLQHQQMNSLGFNLEQHQQQQHHHQQQQQHNFFSINRLGTSREQELPDQFQSRVQQQQLHQHNFLSQNPASSVPVREQEQLFQLQHQHRDQEQLFQQVQPFQVTSAPPQQNRPQHHLPMQPTQISFSWPQAPPVEQLQPEPEPEPEPEPRLQPAATGSQPQPEAHQKFQHETQQQESLQEEPEAETETETADENVDDSPSFWTTCPYCLYMYEYPSVYAECVLRCNTCKRAFQAVCISSPPQIAEGQDSYFYCWGFYPLAVSFSQTQNNNGSSNTQRNSNWAPFSPMYDVSSQVQDHLNFKAAPKKSNQDSGPRIYIDDETDDIFDGISEPSDDSSSDHDWNSSKKKKAKIMKKDQLKDARNGNTKNLSSIPVRKKASGVTTRRQSVRAAKELGRLDLNVEFNNNEGEEATARTGSGNRGNAQGDGDNIEGIGFFEGLDEFFSSLPILSVVNDDKVKAG